MQTSSMGGFLLWYNEISQVKRRLKSQKTGSERIAVSFNIPDRQTINFSGHFRKMLYKIAGIRKVRFSAIEDIFNSSLR